MSDDVPGRSTLLTPSDWDAAIAEGRLSGVDVLERLERIAVYEFGEAGSAGYDAAGFVISLTADGLRVEGGIHLVIHSNDHPPPHVHIQRRGRPEVTLSLEDGTVIGNLPSGVRSKQVKQLSRLVDEHGALLWEWWQKGPGR